MQSIAFVAFHARIRDEQLPVVWRRSVASGDEIASRLRVLLAVHITSLARIAIEPHLRNASVGFVRLDGSTNRSRATRQAEDLRREAWSRNADRGAAVHQR
jgi:hypothetical protein